MTAGSIGAWCRQRLRDAAPEIYGMLVSCDTVDTRHGRMHFPQRADALDVGDLLDVDRHDAPNAVVEEFDNRGDLNAVLHEFLSDITQTQFTHCGWGGMTSGCVSIDSIRAGRFGLMFLTDEDLGGLPVLAIWQPAASATAASECLDILFERDPGDFGFPWSAAQDAGPLTPRMKAAAWRQFEADRTIWESAGSAIAHDDKLEPVSMPDPSALAAVAGVDAHVVNDVIAQGATSMTELIRRVSFGRSSRSERHVLFEIYWHHMENASY